MDKQKEKEAPNELLSSLANETAASPSKQTGILGRVYTPPDNARKYRKDKRKSVREEREWAPEDVSKQEKMKESFLQC